MKSPEVDILGESFRTCGQCGSQLLIEEKFCPHCGKGNSAYTDEIFRKNDGRTPEQAGEDCNNGHAELRAELERKDATGHQPYCPRCGSAVGLN